MSKIGIIAQAHMGSTRLRNKMLKDLYGRSVIGCVITRLRQVKNADALIVAISDEPEDDILVQELETYGVDYYRGSNSDVLSRFYCAAQKYKLTDIVRVCSDNTLIDFRILEDEINFYKGGKHEVVTSGSHIPLGLGGEIFPLALLQKAYENASEPYQHEHVTPYIYEHCTDVYRYDIEQDYSKYRFTLDTEDDWKLIRNIYRELHAKVANFTLSDVIDIMKSNPEWYNLNSAVRQKPVK